MHDEGVHLPCFGAEASNAITALLRGAEFELEEWVITRTDDAEVVGHISPNAHRLIL